MTANDPIHAELQALLRRFRRQRPLRSGSLLITVLGDAIAPRGGRVSLGSLIRLGEPFGLPERLVRTTVARLAQDGWLTARRSGRTSEYALTAAGRRRFASATQRIYAARPHAWKGGWTLVLLQSSARDVRRERAREELRWLGFGQLAPDVFVHPMHRGAQVRARLADAGVLSPVMLTEARQEHSHDDRRLVRAGWNLNELTRAYQRFVRSFAPLADALLSERAQLTPEVAFVARTLLIHEYRRIHLRDPLLPDALLPAHWVGASAYELCRRLYRRLFAVAERHLTAHAERLGGGLPPASRAARARFARAR
jgi:phenylacetic acid degradation operon negative regulatory protein